MSTYSLEAGQAFSEHALIPVEDLLMCKQMPLKRMAVTGDSIPKVRRYPMPDTVGHGDDVPTYGREAPGAKGAGWLIADVPPTIDPLRAIVAT